METQDTRDVVEAVVATFLCTGVAIFAHWLGRKYLDMDNQPQTHVHLYMHQEDGETPCDEEEESDA